jgi:hypothetical protein
MFILSEATVGGQEDSSNGADGGFPYGVILNDKGNLYGTTQAFGKYNAGVAFEITP